MSTIQIKLKLNVALSFLKVTYHLKEQPNMYPVYIDIILPSLPSPNVLEFSLLTMRHRAVLLPSFFHTSSHIPQT